MKALASLDVGTSKTVFLIGEIDSHNDIHVMSKGEAPSKGVDRGSITDLKYAANSINEAIKDAHTKSAFDTSEVILGISSHKIFSQNDTENITLSSQSSEITVEHIDKLLESGRNKLKEEGYDIIHLIPKKYKLDDVEGIVNPLKLTGTKLSVDLHAIKVPTTVVVNMKKAVEETPLKVADTLPNIIASAEAVLVEEEKDAGVLLIDIGAGLTDFIIYKDGSPEIVGSVNLAGINITKDILKMMNLPFDEAEKLKKEHGYALMDLVRPDENISIHPRGEDREITISKTEIARIIQARLEEIMDSIIAKIEQESITLDYIHAGVVITGGSANLKGIKEFAEKYFGTSARIGRPLNLGGAIGNIKDPAYATAVGLLIYKAKELNREGSRSVMVSNGNKKRETGFMKKIAGFLSGLKEDLRNMI